MNHRLVNIRICAFFPHVYPHISRHQGDFFVKTIFSCRRLCDALAATRLIAVVALSSFFAIGVMPTSSHAQPLQQTSAQEQNRNTPPAFDARDVQAQTLFSQAVAIERESSEKAIPKYDEIMHRFGRASTPGARQFAARALLNKGGILSRQGNDKGAVLAYERIERNFGNEKTPAIREVLASALVSKAEVFYKQGSTEKTLAIYAQLDEQFRADNNDFINRLIDITRWRMTEIQISNHVALSSNP
jgi:tetratricopeptide (TPR) repeat protein